MIKILKEDINNVTFEEFKNNVELLIEDKINTTYQEMLKNVSGLTKEVLNEVIGVEYINDSGDLYDLDTMDDEDKEILQSKLDNLGNLIDSEKLLSIITDIVKECFI